MDSNIVTTLYDTFRNFQRYQFKTGELTILWYEDGQKTAIFILTTMRTSNPTVLW
jgi:hypothetical protein